MIRQRASNTDRTGRVPTSASSSAARRTRLRDPAAPAVPAARVAPEVSEVPVVPAALVGPGAPAGPGALAVPVVLVALAVPVAPGGPVAEPAAETPSGPVVVVAEMASPESTVVSK